LKKVILKIIWKRIKSSILLGTIADTIFISDRCTTQWLFMSRMVGVDSFRCRNGKRIPADFDFVHIRSIN
jgi:hypothetical protein